MKENRPLVGIGVFVMKEGKVLLAKRKNAFGAGLYGGVGGGHLEHLESFDECARREVREEAGIEIENIRFLCVSNFQDHAPRHYVDIGLVADYKSGEVQNLEPDKKDSVEWYDLDHVPEPMFGVMKNYFEALKTDKKYFDIEH